MATSITVPQAAPVETAPQSTQPVGESTPQTSQPSQPVYQTPQQASRDEVYNRYNALYETPVQQTQPTAPVETLPSTPQAPVETPPPTAPSNPDIEFLRNAVTELQRQNAALLSQINPQTPPATPQPEVVSTSSAQSSHALQQWFELMAANKLEEAENFFLETYGPKLAARLQPQLVQQSVEANRAEVQIERFVTEFEAANQDLMPLRDYVALGAERRLQIAKNENKITDPASFVREYQKAVTDEANALREKFQLARGAGKQEALTTRTTVLSATALPPSPISSGQQQPSGAVVEESPLDYLAMRQKRMLATQGYGPTN